MRYYFSVHAIVVVNEAPSSNILNNPEAMGHVSLLGIELSPWTSCLKKGSLSNLKSCQSGSSCKIQALYICRVFGKCILTAQKESKVQEPE
jgi:hypothetical protein